MSWKFGPQLVTAPEISPTSGTAGSINIEQPIMAQLASVFSLLTGAFQTWTLPKSRRPDRGPKQEFDLNLIG